LPEKACQNGAIKVNENIFRPVGFFVAGRGRDLSGRDVLGTERGNREEGNRGANPSRPEGKTAATPVENSRMKNHRRLYCPARREAISGIISIGGLACFGKKAWAGPFSSLQMEGEKHRFQKEWGHTYEEAFRWKYEGFIGLMKQFEDDLGKDRLIEMIKKGGDEICRQNAKNTPDFSFDEWTQGGSFFQNMMVRDVVERTDRVYEIKVTECLWAKTFKEYDAADIGYALICYNDFASAKEVHPLITLERTKTLMEGQGCCNHRWVWKG